MDAASAAVQDQGFATSGAAVETPSSLTATVGVGTLGPEPDSRTKWERMPSMFSTLSSMFD